MTHQEVEHLLDLAGRGECPCQIALDACEEVDHYPLVWTRVRGTTWALFLKGLGWRLGSVWEGMAYDADTPAWLGTAVPFLCISPSAKRRDAELKVEWFALKALRERNTGYEDTHDETVKTTVHQGIE